jgi:hypothetical protein
MLSSPEAPQVAPPDAARPSKLERRFAVLLHHDHVAAFEQGRAALWAALSAAGVEGGRVLVPAFTCQSVVNAVVAAGAEPVFFDVDPWSLEPDPQRLEPLMSQARALIAIDYFGWPCRALGPLTDLAHALGVAVIDDRAHVMSASLPRPEPASDYTVYSLYKLLACPAGGTLATAGREQWATAVGVRDSVAVGGALARERAELDRLARAAAQRLRPSRSLRQPRRAPRRPGQPPFAPAMTRLTYGLAAVALRSLAARERRARAVGLHLQQHLAGGESAPGARTLTDPISAFLYFPLLLRDGAVAQAVAHARSKGVDLRPAWPPHSLCIDVALPGTRYLRDHLAMWQVNVHISDAAVDDVAHVLGECARI